MRALLLHNPRAGRQGNRGGLLGRIAETLTAHGFQVEVQQTLSAGSASGQAAEAAARGVEVVFACGGDGTVHQVVQGLANTGCRLAVLPMGTANVLARELGLAADPLSAARLYLAHDEPTLSALGERTISLGLATDAAGRSEYFLTLAGAGPDGHLSYELLTRRHSYARDALRLFLRRRFRPFRVLYHEASDSPWEQAHAIAAMTIRVRDLGGLFRGAGRGTGSGAALDAERLHLLLVRGPAALSLPLWFVTNWLHLQRLNPLRRVAQVTEFRCEATAAPAPHVQLDGEYFGRAPVRFSLVPNAVRLLLPKLR